MITCMKMIPMMEIEDSLTFVRRNVHSDSYRCAKFLSQMELNFVTDRDNTNKSYYSDSRPKNYNVLYNIFQRNYISMDNDEIFKEQFIKAVWSNIDKQNNNNGQVAASALAVFMAQSCNNSGDKVFNDIRKKCQTVFLDYTKETNIREKAMEIVSLQYLFGTQLNYNEVIMTMDKLYNVFQCKYNENFENIDNLKTTGIKCWTLLFSILPNNKLCEVSKPVLDTLENTLRSSSLKLRIAAGESIALIYHMIREEVDRNYKNENYETLVDEIELLTNDGSKYRKRDYRAKQRHVFKEILNEVQENRQAFNKTKIRFSKKETLDINNRIDKCYYDFLVDILQDGMNLHLRKNCLIRDLFNLGEPILITDDEMPQEKSVQQKSHKDRKAKNRKVSKGKNRKTLVENVASSNYSVMRIK